MLQRGCRSKAQAAEGGNVRLAARGLLDEAELVTCLRDLARKSEACPHGRRQLMC